MAEGWPKKRRLLGTKITRLDGPEKATGRAKYSFDINRPGMLHARILRRPHAHAKLKSIDLRSAETMPGCFQGDTFTTSTSAASAPDPARKRDTFSSWPIAVNPSTFVSIVAVCWGRAMSR